MIIQSTRFGEVEVSDEMIIEFPHGLPGFLKEKSFAFLPYQQDSPFAFLQSTGDPDLTFLIVDPFTFFLDYDFEIGDDTAGSLGLAEENMPQIFNIVSMREKVEDMTVNLVAPVIINWRDLKAMQIVLENTEYKVRHNLFPVGSQAAEEKGETDHASSHP